MKAVILLPLWLGLLLPGVRAAGPESAGSYVWHLPKGFPEPRVPADNPMTEAKVELGRYLFYDKRMSVNRQSSCATCHKQELAFTDGRPQAIGATGEKHPRSAMSLVNVAYGTVLTWSNPGAKALEQQALLPMFAEVPIELGMRPGDAFLPAVRSDPQYQRLFKNAFPDTDEPYTILNVSKAIACFERSIISARSPYDRYHYLGADDAISSSARRGEILFFSQTLSCFRCHGGFNFSDNTSSAAHAGDAEFHNTGLVYTAPNVGIFEFTKDPKDIGKFSAPTLRNIAVTAPYMHDGSIASLAGVLDHYAAGGGAGRNNPLKDLLIAGFTISTQDKADLSEFLKSLTDEAVLHDPAFANPW
jgi:cytochrome c peroxidase